MSEMPKQAPSRRDAFKTAGRVAAASALAGVAIPAVHAAETSMIEIALVGCGGRGTGAAADALKTEKQGPIKLIAVADVLENRQKSAVNQLENGKLGKQLDLADDRKFIGFDAYKKAMDLLRPGSIVILGTPPAFRWPMFEYAIEKNLNVFMEKPVSVDAASSNKILALAKKADEKNLKVAVGLMCRHCVSRKALVKQIQDGAIGDIHLLRAYRCKGPEASSQSTKEDLQRYKTDLLNQIHRFHSFLWLSGGCYSDFLIHNIDECCWMKGENTWPVSAKGYGGRHYKGKTVEGQYREFLDQNFDSYSVEYTFADGAKLLLEGRTQPFCDEEFASYAHGSKKAALISVNSHSPARCRIFKDQNINSNTRSMTNVEWKGPDQEPSPYELEWIDFIDAIRNDKKYNEAHRGAMASAITAMGRAACHTGKTMTLEDYLKADKALADGVDKLTLDGPSPLKADEHGKYPVPMPGRKGRSEY
ncbi:MAG: Gfo/Idh/MocA family oxidoreductase [Gemmataceae bacterium]